MEQFSTDKNWCWRAAGSYRACGRDCRRYQSITSCTVDITEQLLWAGHRIIGGGDLSSVTDHDN